MCPCHAVCLFFCYYSCCCCRYCSYTQSRYTCYYSTGCFSSLLPLLYFCPCHRVAYLAAAVVAKQAAIKCEVSRCYTCFRSYKHPADHSHPANRTDRIPGKMYRTFRSHKIDSGGSYRPSISYRSCRYLIIHILYIIQTQHSKYVQMTQITLRNTPVKYPPHADPSRLKIMQTSVTHPDFFKSSRPDDNPADHTSPVDHADPPIKMRISCRSYLPLSGVHIIQITQIPLR